MPTSKGYGLRIVGADTDENGHVLVDLSDGRTLRFTLEQVITLKPVAVEFNGEDEPE